MSTKNSIQGDDNAYLKEAAILALKARLYAIFALILSIVGAVLCIYTYYISYGGNLSLEDVGFASSFILIAPFVPSAILAFLAHRSGVQARTLVKKAVSIPAAPVREGDLNA